MKIAVSLKNNSGPDSLISPIFGRCPYFMFVDPDTQEYSIEENPALNESGGAGIKAARFVINQGADAVISGDVGPKASSLLIAEGVVILQQEGETAHEVIEAFKDGWMNSLFKPAGDGQPGKSSIQ